MMLGGGSNLYDFGTKKKNLGGRYKFWSTIGGVN